MVVFREVEYNMPSLNPFNFRKKKNLPLVCALFERMKCVAY